MKRKSTQEYFLDFKQLQLSLINQFQHKDAIQDMTSLLSTCDEVIDTVRNLKIQLQRERR